MSSSQGRLAHFLLRHGAPFARLRKLPVLGRWASWAGAKLVPRDALTWAQVQRGPAQGVWLHLNPRTGTTYFEGSGEPEVQDAFRQHLQPGMTFYDIGANIGFFTLLAGRAVGEGGRVVAFEADPEIAMRLREHVARNGYEWITVEEKAVWSEPRTILFERVDPSASPDRGLGHVVSARAKATIEVSAVSLDEYSETGPAPDFIKCDVEGAEVEVFRGAERLLKEKRPGIVCEIHSEENQRILLEMFSQRGYVCEPCGTNHILARFP